MAAVRRRTLSAVLAVTSMFGAGLTGLVVAPAAHATGTANIQITEVAYGGKDTAEDAGTYTDGEYVELTNVGDAAQNFAGWKYFVDTTDTTDTTPSSEPASGGIDLSSFGTVQPGESVIVTDLTPADFRAEWGLKDSVGVVQDNNWDPANPTVAPSVKVSLDKGPDNINVFDGSGALADHVWYKSKGIGYGGTNVKGVAIYAATTADLAKTDISTWPGASSATVTSDPDAWTSASGAIGSPGASTLGTSTPCDTKTDQTGCGGTPAISVSPATSLADGASVTVAGSGFTPNEGVTIFQCTTATPSDTSTDCNAGGAATTTSDGTGAFSTSLTVHSADGAHVFAEATTQPGDVAPAFTIAFQAPIDPNWRNIVINEITSDNNDNTELTSHLPAALNAALGTNGRDLVELYNKGTQAVDITGWLQSDNHGSGSASDFSGRVYDVSGNKITSIPAGGYGVFNSSQGLGSGGDAVQIFLPNMTLVDAISFGPGQAGYDESLDPEDLGPEPSTEVYHALARCGGTDPGTVTSTADDANSEWYSVKAASFGTSNAASCDTSTDPAAAVQHYNEQPPTGFTGNNVNGVNMSTCAPSAPSDSNSVSVPDAVAWPTSDGVTTVDDQCEFITPQDQIGNDISSLVFSSDGDVLWAAQNKNHIWKLINDPATGKYLPATDNNWNLGKAITFTGTDATASQPDDEGLTIGPNGNLFVTSERDNTNSKVSKDEVLEYDPTASGTTLAPVNQWDLTSEFVPSVIAATGDDANLGFEGVTYVPDSFLTTHGFHDQHLDKTYDPADYPLHGSGLFFLGFEKNGHVYAYALNTDGTFQRVADIDTGIDGTSAIADLQFNADDEGIWLDCDNDCGVVDSLMQINAQGDFARVASYNRPAGLPDDNMEGFAIAPASAATNGKREVVWSDDGIYGEGNAWNSNLPSADWGHALYSSTIPVDAAPASITGTVTPSGTLGTAYSSPALSTTGAFPDVITYSVTGSLPDGLSLNPATGAISGTPTAAGTFNFTISASNGIGTAATKAATIIVSLRTLSNTPTPTISGTGAVGTQLIANVGTWDSGVTTHYQWLDGTTVLGTDAPYTVAASEAGRTITLSVTGSETGYSSVTKTATIVATKGTLAKVTPTITGTPKVGSMLTAHVGTWGPGTVRISIQWYADKKPIAGATHATLQLAPSQAGKTITVVVTASEAGYNTVTVTSAPTAKVKNGAFSFSGVIKITGTPKVGKVLTAGRGTFKAPGASKITYTYQWFANGTRIKGATQQTLRLGKAQRGKKLSVTVTASAAGFTSLAEGSAKTRAVAS